MKSHQLLYFSALSYRICISAHPEGGQGLMTYWRHSDTDLISAFTDWRAFPQNKRTFFNKHQYQVYGNSEISYAKLNNLLGDYLFFHSKHQWLSYTLMYHSTCRAKWLFGIKQWKIKALINLCMVRKNFTIFPACKLVCLVQNCAYHSLAAFLQTILNTNSPWLHTMNAY